jgi:hypothetical protein
LYVYISLLRNTIKAMKKDKYNWPEIQLL